jgi:uncharacterized protein YwgA
MKLKGSQAVGTKMPLEDWLLLFFYKEGENTPKNPFEITNEIFLFFKDISSSAEPNLKFTSTATGPYSSEVAEAVDVLTSEGFLSKSKSSRGNMNMVQYEITDKGKERTRKIEIKLLPSLKEELKLLRTIVDNMGPVGMTQFLQSMHPEYVFLNREA